MIQTLSHSVEETEAFAQQLAPSLHSGDVLAYRGPMGAGKTAFTRGLARGLGLEDPVSSPTFALVHQYGSGAKALYHFDMYRISSEDDLESTGFYDYDFEDNVAAVEWSENIEEFLPKNTIYITIDRLSELEREITIEDGGRFAAAWN